MNALAELRGAVPWYYSSFSALDRYFRRTEQPVIHIAVEGDLVALAKIVDHLDFPHVDHADAATWDGERRIYFHCLDGRAKPKRQTFRLLNFMYDPEGDRYLDPYDDYESLRGSFLEATDEPYEPLDRLMDAAAAVSRYPHSLPKQELEPVRSFPEIPVETQRTLLSSILTGPSPDQGLGVLKEAGFVDHYWPELSPMSGTAHSKEHHPEGDVWIHSLETFRYRKTLDLPLTLALLLHDSGKPHATPAGNRKFDGHSEVGARLSQRFLGRLGYTQRVMEDVRWLVTNHMFPGALHRLPVYRTESLMENELFPFLLELYRCDLESTYRGPSGYFQACKIYRTYLRNSNNPYRSSQGKILVRRFVD